MCFEQGFLLIVAQSRLMVVLVKNGKIGKSGESGKERVKVD
jgi:hypothetical protein